MAMKGQTKPKRAVIGNATNFWLYSSETSFDLTHPPTPDSPPIQPAVTFDTATKPITIDPAKSALVIIDMQNYFLSPAFGRARGAGHAALTELVDHAIPAARRAGIRIIWLNWGLTDREVEEMPPAVTRAFGFTTMDGAAVNKHGDLLDGNQDRSVSTGLGSSCGTVEDPDTGKHIDAGGLLMRGAWNSSLYPPLDRIYAEGARPNSNSSLRPDVWIHKNRMSGLWGGGAPSTACEAFLAREGIATLLFAGVNTDQCVGGTLTDAFSKGYDCVLLSDGAGTTSPAYAQHGVQFNAANTWGFSTTCKAFADGVGKAAGL